MEQGELLVQDTLRWELGVPVTMHTSSLTCPSSWGKKKIPATVIFRLKYGMVQ